MQAPLSSGLAKLIDVVKCLRNPEGGCPWDLKQTHESLRPYVLEESYELVEAITSGDLDHIKEELGDVLLQVVLHAQLGADNQTFTLDDVGQGIADKLIRRHPHVFGDVVVDSAEAVMANWQKIKADEKGGETPKSAMDGVSEGMPALSRALKVSKKAVAEGFEWPDFDSLWDCVMSEYREFREAKDESASFERLEDELGDILFASVNLARYHQIDPEVALTRATNKFMRRYRIMESLTDKPLAEQDFETLDALWTLAKQQLSK